MTTLNLSEKLFRKAGQIMPGAVNSPVRAFKPVGGRPLFIEKAKGSAIFDVDGRKYIDYVGSWGPMIAGHANPRVLGALRKVMENGTSFGAPTQLEVEMAEMVIDAVPSVEMVRMVNSGTEATMSAVRVARGYTGRDKIIKLDGCYHGHGDSLLVQAGSGVETLGLPDSPGVPSALASLTMSIPYNDLSAMQTAFEKADGQVACVIIEPVVGNMGVLPPAPGYLEGIRTLCDEHGAILIFDEVMTGFRLAYGGAQELYGVTPDMTTLGKIIGGGLPVGAYGGKRGIMEQVAPSGPIYQAGTLSGNPLAMAAGIETLKILREEGAYEKLETLSSALEKGIRDAVSRAGIPATLNRVGAMFSIFFTENERVTNYNEAKTCDTARFAKYFSGMLGNGVYLAPSQFEAGFMSLSHTSDDVADTIEAVNKTLANL